MKLAAATREEKNKRIKRIRVGIGFIMISSGGGNGGVGAVKLKQETPPVFNGI